MRIPASYLPSSGDDARNPSDLVPELSRRARGFATWAMIRRLGRRGIAEDGDATLRAGAAVRAEACRSSGGVTVLNEVVLNQVAVHSGSEKAQLDCAGAGGRDLFCRRCGMAREASDADLVDHQSTEADVERSVAAMLSAWDAVRRAN